MPRSRRRRTHPYSCCRLPPHRIGQHFPSGADLLLHSHALPPDPGTLVQSWFRPVTGRPDRPCRNLAGTGGCERSCGLAGADRISCLPCQGRRLCLAAPTRTPGTRGAAGAGKWSCGKAAHRRRIAGRLTGRIPAGPGPRQNPDPPTGRGFSGRVCPPVSCRPKAGFSLPLSDLIHERSCPFRTGVPRHAAQIVQRSV